MVDPVGLVGAGAHHPDQGVGPPIVLEDPGEFGTAGAEAFTWATNAYLPGVVADRYRGARLVVFSTGCVYPLVPVVSGGATEETIIARVGEGIITAIGSAERHSDVLESPDQISRAVLNRGLDAQTAFEIVSIDIAEITVGDNIGARLRADQAEADMRVARAKAEGRRAMAVAEEQENIAKIEENRAKLIEAEAEVPKAIAEAFQTGKLGIMDYYRLRNVQADTDMRLSIARAGAPGGKKPESAA